MFVLTLIILSFLFSIVLLIVFLVTYHFYTKSSLNQTKKSKAIAYEKVKSEQTNPFKDEQILKKGLASLRQSEELLQGQLKEMEIDKITIQKEKEQLMLEREENDKLCRIIQDEKIEFAKSKEEFEEAHQLRTQFLTNMSHELKTPLNSILTLTQVLIKNKSKNLEEKQIKFLKTVYSSGKTLLSLINDTLDIAKIESGKTETFIEPITIQSIKDEIYETFFIQREKSHITFSIEVDDAIPEIIYSDKKRLLQILRNILSNAFKFTESGYVKLMVQNQNSKKNPVPSILTSENYIVFSVEDTGIGIEKDKQEMIFEEFVQGDSSTTRKYGGSGLGLAISKKLVTLLGGDIQLQSKYRLGSTFNIFFPISGKKFEKREKEKGIQKTRIDDRKNDKQKLDHEMLKRILKSKKIVMITSDMKYLFLFTNLVEGYHGSVIGTDNIEEGVRKVIDNPDASFVVIDEYMFRRESKRLLQEFKTDGNENTKRIIIIPQKDTDIEGFKREFSEHPIKVFFPSSFEKNELFEQMLKLK